MEKQDRIFTKEITDTVIWKHFNTFFDSLKLHNPKYKEIRLKRPELQEPTAHYICPLCVTAQFILNGNTFIKFEEFSLDHVPPESIGGKAKILTCKACNNTAGEYEVMLQERIRLQAFGDNKDGAVIKKLSVKENVDNSSRHKGFMTKDEEGTIFLDFPEAAKEHNQELKTMLDQFGGIVQELQITVRTPDEEKLSKALLKTAYLLCFIHWGYEFIYSDTGYKIRQVLQGKEKYPLPLPVVLVDKAKQELPIGVGIIQKPADLQSFYVTFSCIEGDNNYTAMVIIPPPNGWNRLQEIHEYYVKNNGLDYDCTMQSLEQSLPHNLNGYSESWNNFLKTIN